MSRTRFSDRQLADMIMDGTSKTCEQSWLNWLKEVANG